MGSPQECSTLLRIIGEALKCEARCSAAETPSHVDKDDEGGLIPRGCLIAHLSLTLIEMQRVSPYFRASLHNLSAFYSVGGSPSIDAGSYWDLLLTSSILHDIGKLADEYTAMGAVKGDGARHHQISA
ncbi:MAG: hypothetical protein N3E47_08445, partial [Candidatus Bathyarchaeota archaeon]|nr:hypothetical protein [Candidatus Bathyarchaeota archaeon]